MIVTDLSTLTLEQLHVLKHQVAGARLEEVHRHIALKSGDLRAPSRWSMPCSPSGRAQTPHPAARSMTRDEPHTWSRRL